MGGFKITDDEREFYVAMVDKYGGSVKKDKKDSVISQYRKLFNKARTDDAIITSYCNTVKVRLHGKSIQTEIPFTTAPVIPPHTVMSLEALVEQMEEIMNAADAVLGQCKPGDVNLTRNELLLLRALKTGRVMLNKYLSKEATNDTK